MRSPAALVLLAAVAVPLPAYADNSPLAPGDPAWAARGQLGYSKTSGNTDNSAGNFLLHVAHVTGDWKVLFGAEGLYGSTHGETTAQAWDAHLQANYNITSHFYWYAGVRYDDDRFSGFAFQESIKTGAGYQFVQTNATKFAAQMGAGYRRLRPEILVKDDIGGVISRTPLDEQSDAVFDGALTFEHAFNQNTKLLAAATVQSGKENTLTTASVSLQVKMTNRLALAAGYQLTDNSQPPQGSERRDTLTTLNLVYELKNEKLAPE
jgi:putative salt-induced outer membrane protein